MSFGVNMLALNDGRPMQMNLKELLAAFVAFREEVVTRRTKFDLTKARDRGHVLVGLAVAVANIDEVIGLIRAAPDAASAREQLMARAWPAKDVAPLVALIADPRHRMEADGTIRLSEEQAKAILDLRLQRLTALGRDEINDEAQKLGLAIADYLDILSSRGRVLAIISDELKAIRDEFATPRKTELIDAEIEVEDEALIEREDVAVTVTHAGYIKRTPLAEYRVQGRGGKGRSGMATRDEDFVTSLFVASTHARLLFFSSTGMAYKLKVWRLPEARIAGKGKAMVNLLPLAQGERITTILALPEDEARMGQAECGLRHQIRRCAPQRAVGFRQVNKNGKIAMKLGAGDGIIGVATCTERTTSCSPPVAAKAIRFPVADVRVFKGRDSTGVRGIKLASGDEVVSLSLLYHSDASSAEARAYLKQASAARRAESGEAEAPVEERGRCRGGRRGSDLDAGALCGAGRARAVRAHHVADRFRQAHLIL